MKTIPKNKMIRILEQIHRYNSDRMTTHAFGLDPDTEYDALVVAPSYTPYKLKMDEYCKVTTLKEGSYIAGYLVEKDGLKIAWIKIASSDSNLIDHIAICAELKFRKNLRMVSPLGRPLRSSFRTEASLNHQLFRTCRKLQCRLKLRGKSSWRTPASSTGTVRKTQ